MAQRDVHTTPVDETAVVQSVQRGIMAGCSRPGAGLCWRLLNYVGVTTVLLCGVVLYITEPLILTRIRTSEVGVAQIHSDSQVRSSAFSGPRY